MNRYWMAGALTGALVVGLTATGAATLESSEARFSMERPIILAMGRRDQEEQQPDAMPADNPSVTGDSGMPGSSMEEQPAQGGGGIPGGTGTETEGSIQDPVQDPSATESTPAPASNDAGSGSGASSGY